VSAVTTRGPARVYGGWQRDRSAFLFGLTPARAGLCVGAVLLLMVPVIASSLPLALLTVPGAVLVVGLAFVRVAGRTANEWIGDATRFTVARARKQTLFLSGAGAPRDAADPTGPAPMDLPGTLAPLRFLRAETGLGTYVAVVHHPLDNTYTIVAAVHGAGLSLSESSRQDARVASWGAVLASLCTENNAFVRVQVCLRTVPGDGTALRRWHAEHTVATAPALAVANAEDLLALSTPASAQHDAWLAFTMSASRARSDIRGAGDGDAAACAVLWRRVRSFEETLRQASLSVESWLDVRDLAEVIRTGFDPASVPALSSRRLAARSAQARGHHMGLEPGVDPAVAGPVAADNGWKTYRHDSAVSVTYVVHDWPRNHVWASFLAPLLAHNGTVGARRSFSLHLEPLGPRAAQRKITVEATKAETALALARKTGRVVGAEDLAARRRIAEQDSEQAAGHGLVRFMGYLTVTVDDAAELDRACADVEADASHARIELRRMYSQQDVGFFASVLPLGMGLPLVRGL
jgi:hypothetical protein